MKLLNVITSVDPNGGGPIESIHQIVPLLSARGHLSEIACLDAPSAPWLMDLPLKVHALGPGVTGYRYSRKLAHWLRNNAARFDAVIVHGLWQYGSFATWQALHTSSTPYYVYTHGMLDPWFKRRYPLKHLRKSLYWPWGEYRVLRDAAAVLFTCEEERLLARQSFRHYRVNEIVVSFGAGAPPEEPAKLRAAFFAAYPELAHKRNLLFLGRLHVKKGCDLLVEAFATVARSETSLHLVMAGPDKDGLQPQLQILAERLGIADRISWTGMLTGDLKWGAFYASDVFVLPSHQENFGIAVAESLACGLPVLISDKINIWREIREAGAGLIAEDTLEGAKHLLQEWVTLPEQVRQQMAENAQKCFLSHFEMEQAADSLLRVLEPQNIGKSPLEVPEPFRPQGK